MKPAESQQDVIGTTWRSYVAEAPAWGIVAGALAVSFWTQVDEVQRHGFAVWEALIWGSSTDAGTIACLFLAREGAHRGTPTWGAWVLSSSRPSATCARRGRASRPRESPSAWRC